MAADDDLRADAEWNRAARDETDTERLDRNWNDLLQELRVSQTGVQLLTGLLLTVPFQSRFPDLLAHQRIVYLVALGLSIAATALLIAPVLLHRLLFRKHARASLVAAGQVFAIAGLGTLGLAVVAVLDLIFDVVLGAAAGVVAASCGLAVFTGLWLVYPLVVRHRLD